MASYTVVDYLNARLPNLAVDLPGVSPDMLAMGAMAVYWSFFMHDKPAPEPDINEELLTERQKVICALRAAVTIFPTILTNKAANGFVTEGTAGPATGKFADPSKIYKQIGDAMVAELELMESAEGVMLKPGEGVPPAYLLTVNSYDELLSANLVVSRQIFDLNWVR